jgi:ribonuclease HI
VLFPFKCGLDSKAGLRHLSRNNSGGSDTWDSFRAGAVAILISPSKMKTSYAPKLEFQCTNNIVEYKALLLGLCKLKAMGVKRIVPKSNSQVITCHVEKSIKARNPTLEKYLDIV